MKIPIRTILAVMTYAVPFLRHVTPNKTYEFCMFSNILAVMTYDVPSNKTCDFCMFSKFINFVPIYLKIGTHIDCPGPILCTLKKCIDQNNRTYVSMATKYPIIKHRAFFKTLTFCISTNNEDIGQKLLPDT